MPLNPPALRFDLASIVPTVEASPTSYYEMALPHYQVIPTGMVFPIFESMMQQFGFYVDLKPSWEPAVLLVTLGFEHRLMIHLTVYVISGFLLLLEEFLKCCSYFSLQWSWVFAALKLADRWVFPLCLSPLLSFLLSPLGRHVLLLCSLARTKLDIFIPDYMVLMERSRSPNRSPPLQAGLRPLVNFPVWTHPMENRAQTPTSGQYHSNLRWSQEPQGSSTLPEVPLSQQSMMIPPGQPGASQQSLDLSQPSVAHVVSPRPQVQGLGIGMAGMMQTFPPPSIVGTARSSIA